MRTCELSDVTKKYLKRFYCILDEMIEGMTSASLNHSLSHNFIVQMIPHHRAAIEMSENLLQYTTYIPLQNIAQDIIAEQTKSIQNMQSVLPVCGMLCNTVREINSYKYNYNEIIQRMFSQMGNAPSMNDMNADFMLEMIPHHLGAIEMSENALEYPICPELTPILEAIITSQKQGVREMERLLRYRQDRRFDAF